MVAGFVRWLEGANRSLCFVGALLMTIGIGYLDYLTGPELGFSFFYLIPVALAGWTVGRAAGLATAGCCTAAWLLADLAAGSLYSSDLVRYWNGGVRMGIFAVVALLLSTLREALRKEQELSRHDTVTAAVNSRHFREILSGELARAGRSGQPLTLAYFDLDNFKAVNDSLGHDAGDEVLRQCVATLVRQLRGTDVVGRLGGDEFGCLLPDTGQEGAAIVLEKLRQSLGETMHEGRWPVTVSVGAVTFQTPPKDADEAIRLADELMYQVKHGGKDALKHVVVADQPPGSR